MPVYVDNMLMAAEVPNGAKTVKGRWSHLTADTTEELHAFAKKLGLRRSWFQPAKTIPDNEYTRAKCPDLIGQTRPGSRDHYDVTERVRAKAIALGAVACRMGCEGWRDRKKEREDDGRLFGEAAAPAGAPAQASDPAPTEAGGHEPVDDGSHYGQ